jgi:hypothetical protein
LSTDLHGFCEYWYGRQWFVLSWRPFHASVVLIRKIRAQKSVAKFFPELKQGDILTL